MSDLKEICNKIEKTFAALSQIQSWRGDNLFDQRLQRNTESWCMACIEAIFELGEEKIAHRQTKGLPSLSEEAEFRKLQERFKSVEAYTLQRRRG